MAWTHSIRSCSSSQANITRSPSRTALKNTRPPCSPEEEEEDEEEVKIKGFGPDVHFFCTLFVVSDDL